MGIHWEILQSLSHVPRRHAFTYVASNVPANFLDRVEVRIGSVKAHTWKELAKQAEIAEKSAKKFEPSVLKNKWGSAPKDVIHPNLPNPRGKKRWQLSYLGKLHQSRRGAISAIIRNSSFCQDNTHSKMNRWWPFFTYSTKVISLSYLKSGDQVKWGVQMTLTTTSFTSSQQ